MPASPNTSVLVTGANSGIGKEVARQFAETDSFDTIYLACRNQTKAEAARDDLERTTGKSIFTTVPLDTSDLGSVRAAIGFIDTPLKAIVMNAGGAGGSTPMTLTADGATEIFASNVLGHAALVEQLIASDALTGVGRSRRKRGRPWCAEAKDAAAHIRRTFGGRVRQRNRWVVLCRAESWNSRLRAGQIYWCAVAFGTCPPPLPPAPAHGQPGQHRRHRRVQGLLVHCCGR